MNITDIIGSLEDKDYSSASAAFKEVMKEKTQNALDSEKRQVAQNMFGEQKIFERNAENKIKKDNVIKTIGTNHSAKDGGSRNAQRHELDRAAKRKSYTQRGNANSRLKSGRQATKNYGATAKRGERVKYQSER